MVNPERKHPQVFLITGERGSGKTTFLQQLNQLLAARNIQAGGILALGSWKAGQRFDFILQDLSGKNSILFCKRELEQGWIKRGHFYINPEALEFGNRLLAPENLKNCRVVIIDEIGPFELAGDGWAKPLSQLIYAGEHTLVLSVRKALVNAVVDHWSLKEWLLFDVAENTPDEVALQLEVGNQP